MPKKLIFLLILLLVIGFTGYSIFAVHSSSLIKISNVSLLKNIKLKHGDIIFRRGLSLESQIVLISDRNSEFSHIGLIYIKNKKRYVIHSTPSESENSRELIKMENVDDFLDEDKASKFAIYRLTKNREEISNAACNFSHQCYQNKYTFDNNYNLSTDNELYCTELIWKAYKHAGIDLVENRLKKINFLFLDKTMILPSSILQSKQLRLIYSN